jgi:hypothetical protein
MIWRQTLLAIPSGLGLFLVAFSFSAELFGAGHGASQVSHMSTLLFFTAGLSIGALGIVVRQLAAQLDTLEEKISKLKWSLDQAKLDKKILPAVI